MKQEVLEILSHLLTKQKNQLHIKKITILAHDLLLLYSRVIIFPVCYWASNKNLVIRRVVMKKSFVAAAISAAFVSVPAMAAIVGGINLPTPLPIFESTTVYENVDRKSVV